MNKAELNIVKEWFLGHVRGFASPSGTLPSVLQLKVEHSVRVARDARAMAQEMGWTASDVNTAEAAGWLHDVGRFAQFHESGTFDDSRSMNHGARGWETVSLAAFLSVLTPHDRACVLDTIRHHNAKTVPSCLGNGSERCLCLIRDADKLDIFGIVHQAIMDDGFQDLPEMLPRVRLDGPVSDSLLDELRTEQCASLENVVSLADFLLMQLSWVYDINHASTFARVAERDIVGKIASQLPMESLDVSSIVQAARNFAERRIPLMKHANDKRRVSSSPDNWMTESG